MIENLTNKELLELERKVKQEKINRKISLTAERYRKGQLKAELYEYGNNLILFLNAELGYSLRDARRKRIYTNARFIFANHLRQKGMSLKVIGKLLLRDHATIITSLKQFSNLKETNDVFFMILYEKITQLIERYDNTKQNSSPTKSI